MRRVEAIGLLLLCLALPGCNKGGGDKQSGAGAASAAFGAGSAATGSTAATDACQQRIRENYPPGGADQTITVSFLAYETGAAQPYVATYANDNNGVGHTVNATPIHAKYTVLTHYADPRADDELRTYDAQYMCYQSAAGGGLVVEMVSRLPGGETAQYIHKS